MATNDLFRDAVEALDRIAGYLLEAHQPELEDCHCGDEIHTGPAPESCSYCNAIDEAKQVLAAAGCDISHLEGEC